MPDDDGFTTATELLVADAKSWDDFAKDVGPAAQAADDLVLTVQHFGFLADDLGMTEVYQRVQRKFAHLLHGAATNFRDVAAALRECAKTYEQVDDQNAQKLNQIKR
ncbi:hypothetical protein ABT324_06490 [Saccharopolyspora sp. NPDC000359]|uniref:hypothetical protein n=1 Tax=Saccharopolyspora sp. NPDC000359 TaxID=3154251 RepID=UPI003321F32C